MGKIVIDGKRCSLGPVRPYRNDQPTKYKRGFRAQARIGNKKIHMECFSDAKAAAGLDDLTLVRKTFSATMSEALRLALHLTADAIRAGKMSIA